MTYFKHFLLIFSLCIFEKLIFGRSKGKEHFLVLHWEFWLCSYLLGSVTNNWMESLFSIFLAKIENTYLRYFKSLKLVYCSLILVMEEEVVWSLVTSPLHASHLVIPGHILSGKSIVWWWRPSGQVPSLWTTGEVALGFVLWGWVRDSYWRFHFWRTKWVSFFSIIPRDTRWVYIQDLMTKAILL